VLANDLEAVILRHADGDECLIDDTADFLPVGRVLVFAMIDTNKCIFFSFFSKHWVRLADSAGPAIP
jgi:hypothetical protein